jgi:hypothetical protein
MKFYWLCYECHGTRCYPIFAVFHILILVIECNCCVNLEDRKEAIIIHYGVLKFGVGKAVIALRMKLVVIGSIACNKITPSNVRLCTHCCIHIHIHIHIHFAVTYVTKYKWDLCEYFHLKIVLNLHMCTALYIFPLGITCLVTIRCYFEWHCCKFALLSCN